MAAHGEQESLLHHAAWTGETETILDLLERGDDPNELDDNGWTPLHVATLSGNIESVRILIRSGANPAARNGDGHTPLELAEERGHREVSYALRLRSDAAMRYRHVDWAAAVTWKMLMVPESRFRRLKQPD